VDPAEAPPHDPLADPRVFQAIQDYQAEIDAGHRPDRAEFVSRYPDVAEEVAGCLDGFDFLRAASPRAAHHGHSGAAVALAAESRLGEFRLLREVGRGGMGVVYEAEQPSLGRRVALKVVAGPALDDRTRQRFRNEAHAAASLHHPHIVPVYAVGAEGESLFLAMQFVAGRSLAAVVRQLQCPTGPAAETAPNTAADTGPYTPPPTAPAEKAEPLPFPAPPAADYYRATARLAADAADALQHAHDLGIVHRDVKPGNLLVEPTGHLWVADFGLARLPGSGDLTRTGEMLGTLRYTSPEQVAGAAVDHRTDVYSLGATLYELLTLHPAFPGTDPHDVLRRIASEEPPAPRAVVPDVPRDLETVVLKAMAKDPGERYPTARELAADLQRFLDDRPVLARRPSLPHRLRKWSKRNRGLVAAGLAVAFLFLASAVAVLAVTADRIQSARDETEKTNQDLTRTVGQRDGAIQALEQTVAERDGANVDLKVKVRAERSAVYTYRFLAARQAWLVGNFARASQLLDECPDEFRRWEWGFLKQLCRPGMGALQCSPTEFDARLVFSPNGTRLVLLTGEAVEVWDVPSDALPAEKPRLRLTRPRCRMLVAVFPAGGKHLITAGYDGKQPITGPLTGELCVWDLQSGALVRSFELPGKPMAFTPDGEHVLCTSRTAAILVRVADGRPVPEFRPGKTITFLDRAEYSPSGRLLAVGKQFAGVTVLDAATGATRAAFVNARTEVRGLSFSPNERYVASHTDTTVIVWDIPAGRERVTLYGHTGGIQDLVFAPDGRGLVTTARDLTTRIWEVKVDRVQQSEKEQHVFRGAGSQVAVHPDGRRLASAAGRSVVFWDTTTGQEGRAFPREDAFESRLGFTADGERVVRHGLLSPPDGEPYSLIRTLDIATGREVAATRHATRHAPRLAIPVDGVPGSIRLGAPDGLLLWRPFREGDWSIWNVTTGRDVVRLGPEPREFAAHVSPDGSTLALVGRNAKQIRLVDTATGKERFLDPGPPGPGVLAFHPTGDYLACGSGTGPIRILDFRTGQLVRTLTEHRGAVHGLAYHPGGELLVSGGADGRLRVWDLRTGKARAITPHEGTIAALAVSPDGDRVATAVGRSVQVWDLHTGEEYLALTTTSNVQRLTFTDNNKYLVAEGILFAEPVVWDAAVADPETKHARLATRTETWYRAAAAACAQDKDWFAAVWHLERLVALAPTNASYKTRLQKARAALAAQPANP
jgi:eukaryotic-like serine/threonine-protein kinase